MFPYTGNISRRERALSLLEILGWFSRCSWRGSQVFRPFSLQHSKATDAPAASGLQQKNRIEKIKILRYGSASDSVSVWLQVCVLVGISSTAAAAASFLDIYGYLCSGPLVDGAFQLQQFIMHSTQS